LVCPGLAYSAHLREAQRRMLACRSAARVFCFLYLPE
jgi:hypothetical protein